jgi:hypothetical protein
MIPANPYRIRFATSEDAGAVRRLAGQGCRSPLGSRVLIAEIDGTPAAALSLRTGRVVSDPSRPTDRLVAALRMRAAAIRAYEATPALRERLLAAFPDYRWGTNVTPLSPVRDARAEHGPVPMKSAA